MYNCNPNNISCYTDDTPPPGFSGTNVTGIINITYCLSINSDYSCAYCSNYRYPNTQVRWSLCYPSNCQFVTFYNCSGNCLTYFGNLIVSDASVCVATNCLQYNTNGACLQCVSYLQLINGTCINNGSCTQFNPISNACTACQNAYFLSNGNCIPMNCSKYDPNNNNQCSACFTGFQLTVNYTCQLKYCSIYSSSFICQTCNIGFLFNYQSGLCQMNYCQNFDYNANVCQLCITYYQIFNGYCRPVYCQNYSPSDNITCTACLQGYTLTSNNTCQISNCYTYNLTSCLVCIAGYYLNNNGLCASYCLQFSTSNVCTQCISGYALNNLNQCVQAIKGCQTYNNAVCIACQPGLLLNQGICTVNYCQIYQASDSTICLTCMPRFYLLTNGLCSARNCFSFDSFNWICTTCQSGFIMINNTFCMTDNCASYQLQNYVCIKCDNTSQGFYQLSVINGS